LRSGLSELAARARPRRQAPPNAGRRPRKPVPARLPRSNSFAAPSSCDADERWNTSSPPASAAYRIIEFVLSPFGKCYLNHRLAISEASVGLVRCLPFAFILAFSPRLLLAAEGRV